MGDRTVIMTAQPGRIKKIIDVPFPHPRDLLQLSRRPSSARSSSTSGGCWRKRHQARARWKMRGFRPRPRSGCSISLRRCASALWQVLLMLGIGDRRFVPAPSDIACAIGVVMSGELARHTTITLYRVFMGFFIGSIPASSWGF